MNVGAILACLANQDVDYLLIGGMNYLLRHQLALPEEERKVRRILVLRRALGKSTEK